MKVYTATQDWRMFSTASALLLLLQWSSVAANFNITFTNFNFDHPNNMDARRMCCNETEGRSNCSTPCNIVAYICIPSNGSTFSNESDQCPNRTLSTRQLTANESYSIPRSWTGRLQLLIYIEEDQDDRNLVATFQIEHISTAAQPNDTELPEVSHTEHGQDGAMLSVSIYVQCNTGFYGPSCDCQNTNDSTGHYTCTREGGIQCLDGYQNPHNNCTELQMPGPTVTLPSATTDVSDISGMFTTSLAIMIDFMSTPVAFTSLLIDPVLTTIITPFTSSLSSLQGPPLTTPAPTPTGIAIPTTPVVISTPTSISLTSSPPVTSGQFQTTTPPLLTTSLPLITTSQTTIQPSLTTVLPSLSTTTTPLTSSLTQTTTQEPEPTITAFTEPSTTTTTTISIETTLSLTTTRGSQPTISASVGTTSSTEPSSRSGNAAVIAGTVVVLTVVVASILVIAVCVYFVVKKNRKKSKLESIVYLDQVYNTPVTFVNPEHEAVSPRSPQLIMTVSGDQENGVEVTHTPSFPSVDYRAHIPYAETGPSSDHTQSPANGEGSQVYQFQDGETTIIANPHSWSRSSESPPPLPPPAHFAAAAAPTSELKNRKSGLGLNDSIGGAKYSKHLPSTSAQSSRSEGGNRQTSSPHLTVPHLSPRGAPKTTPKPASSASRGSGREGGLHKSAVPARPRDNSYGRSRDREEEEEGMQKRVNDYLQSAQEEGERRQSFMKDILFTDINLDMTTQTEL